MTATDVLRVPLTLPSCPGCAGGGDVNGVPCRECGGRGRLGVRARRDWRAVWRSKPVLALAGVAGSVVGWSRSLPGVAGAGGVTFGLAMVTHGVFHRVPELGMAALTAGVFGLLMDRRL